jgi:hypothetical protein
MKNLIFGFVVVLFFTGCASNMQNLLRESAINIGGNLKTEDIKITDINRGALNVSWKAHT